MPTGLYRSSALCTAGLIAAHSSRPHKHPNVHHNKSTDLIEYVRSREIGLQDVGLADVVVYMCGDHIDMESCLCSTLCKHTQTFTLCKSYDTWTYLPGVPNGADGALTTSAPSAFITISCRKWWMELHLVVIICMQNCFKERLEQHVTVYRWTTQWAK